MAAMTGLRATEIGLARLGWTETKSPGRKYRAFVSPSGMRFMLLGKCGALRLCNVYHGLQCGKTMSLTGTRTHRAVQSVGRHPLTGYLSVEEARGLFCGYLGEGSQPALGAATVVQGVMGEVP